MHRFFPEVTLGFNPRTNFPLEKIRPTYERDVIWFVSLARILYRTAVPRTALRLPGGSGTGGVDVG